MACSDDELLHFEFEFSLVPSGLAARLKTSTVIGSSASRKAWTASSCEDWETSRPLTCKKNVNNLRHEGHQ